MRGDDAELLDAPDLLAVRDLPRRDDAVEAAGDAPLAVRVERDRAHEPRVLGVLLELLAGGDVPHAGGAVHAAARSRTCRRRERDRPHARGVADEPLDVAAALDVPEAHAAVARRRSTARRPSAVNAIWLAAPSRDFERVEFAGVVRLRRAVQVREEERAELQFAGQVAERLHPDLPAHRAARGAQRAEVLARASRTGRSCSRNSSGVSPTSAAAVSRSRSASYFSVIVLTASNLRHLRAGLRDRLGVLLRVVLHQLQHLVLAGVQRLDEVGVVRA